VFPTKKRKEKKRKEKQSNKWVVGKRSGYYLTLDGSVKHDFFLQKEAKIKGRGGVEVMLILERRWMEKRI